MTELSLCTLQYLVAGWLAGIIVNLLTVDAPEYYDIALRDFGLLLGALTLARLASAFRERSVKVDERGDLKKVA